MRKGGGYVGRVEKGGKKKVRGRGVVGEEMERKGERNCSKVSDDT